MGMYHSTYFAYGFQIPDTGAPWEMAERLEVDLKNPNFPDVSFLQAGDYDADMTFLVTKSEEISLGRYATVHPGTVTAEQHADWDRQLQAAVETLGLANTPDLMVPGWICVPDLS